MFFLGNVVVFARQCADIVHLRRAGRKVLQCPGGDVHIIVTANRVVVRNVDLVRIKVCALLVVTQNTIQICAAIHAGLNNGLTFIDGKQVVHVGLNGNAIVGVKGGVLITRTDAQIVFELLTIAGIERVQYHGWHDKVIHATAMVG